MIVDRYARSVLVSNIEDAMMQMELCTMLERISEEMEAEILHRFNSVPTGPVLMESEPDDGLAAIRYTFLVDAVLSDSKEGAD